MKINSCKTRDDIYSKLGKPREIRPGKDYGCMTRETGQWSHPDSGEYYLVGLCGLHVCYKNDQVVSISGHCQHSSLDSWIWNKQCQNAEEYIILHLQRELDRKREKLGQRREHKLLDRKLDLTSLDEFLSWYLAELPPVPHTVENNRLHEQFLQATTESGICRKLADLKEALDRTATFQDQYPRLRTHSAMTRLAVRCALIYPQLTEKIEDIRSLIDKDFRKQLRNQFKQEYPDAVFPDD